MDTKLAVDIKCQNATAASTEFEQATTLLLDLQTHFNTNMTYNVNLGLEFYQLDVTYVGSEDSHFELKSIEKINKKVQLILDSLKTFIGKLFNRGHSF